MALALAMLPFTSLPVLAYERSNMPFCYMVTSQGLVINLDRLCGVKVVQPSIQANPAIDATTQITSQDVCLSILNDFENAPTVWKREAAEKRLNYCLLNRDKIDQSLREDRNR